VVGFFMFEFCGVAILGLLSKAEDAFDRWLSPARAVALLLAYFAIWAGIAISLQRQTWLRHIHPSVQTVKIGGLILIYEMVIFIPGGMLIGMAARKWNELGRVGKSVLVLGLLLLPVLLEVLLFTISKMRALPDNIIVSVILNVTGAAVVNADLSRVTE
jgi:hypothetical protein